MRIRPERESEFGCIEDLVRLAFATAKVSNGKEQDFVNQLRASESYIPELALVAEEAGEIIGHILLTRTDIVDGEAHFEALFLGPLSVALAWRNRGIGSQLVREACRLGRDMGFRLVVLVGDPAYYGRLGFVRAANYGIGHQQGIPEQYVQVCSLRPGALEEAHGIMTCC